jgi:hypothetical protein
MTCFTSVGLTSCAWDRVAIAKIVISINSFDGFIFNLYVTFIISIKINIIEFLFFWYLEIFIAGFEIKFRFMQKKKDLLFCKSFSIIMTPFNLSTRLLKGKAGMIIVYSSATWVAIPLTSK